MRFFLFRKRINLDKDVPNNIGIIVAAANKCHIYNQSIVAVKSPETTLFHVVCSINLWEIVTLPMNINFVAVSWHLRLYRSIIKKFLRHFQFLHMQHSTREYYDSVRFELFFYIRAPCAPLSDLSVGSAVRLSPSLDVCRRFARIF